MTGIDVGQPMRLCPVCREVRAVRHCDTPDCFWLRCRNKACDVTVDLRRHVAMTPKGVFRPF